MPDEPVDQAGASGGLEQWSQPVDLDGLEVSASGAITLDAQWIAYLAEAETPTYVAGIDESILHEEGGDTAYA